MDLLNFLDQYAAHTDQRFNRLENQGNYQFTHTMETLKIMHEVFSSGLRYLQLRGEYNNKENDIKLKEILNIERENLLEKIDEVSSMVERNKQLTATEFEYVTQIAEFYLHQQAANSAFNGALLSTINKFISEEEFSAQEVENRLMGKDPFNQLAYIQQSLTYLFNAKPSTQKIANPYVWLKAFDVLIKAILKSNGQFEGYDKDKLTKLVESAEASISLLKSAREKLPQLFKEYEKESEGFKKFISEELKAFNDNNTILGIDIHSPIQELLEQYQNVDLNIQQIKFFRKNFDTKRFHLFAMAPFAVASVDALINTGDLNKVLLDKGINIPAGYVLSTLIKEGKIEYNYDMEYIWHTAPARKLKYMVNIVYVNLENPENKTHVISLNKTVDSTNQHFPVEHFIPDLFNRATDQSHINNKPLVNQYFHRAVLTSYQLAVTEDDIKEFNQNLERHILIDPRKKFAKLFLDPLSPQYTKFMDFRDKLNVSFLRLRTAISIALANVEVPQCINMPAIPVLYNDYTVQNALAKLQVNADLAEIDHMLLNGTFQEYENFQTKILNQLHLARVNSSYTHPIERAMQSAIMFITTLNDRNMKKHANNYSPKNTKKKSSSAISNLLHETVRQCDEDAVLAAIEDTTDLNRYHLGYSAIDLALQCHDQRQRNRLVMHLVQNRAYECAEPLVVVKLLQNILDKSREILSDREYTKLEKSYQRFCNFHDCNNLTPVTKVSLTSDFPASSYSPDYAKKIDNFGDEKNDLATPKLFVKTKADDPKDCQTNSASRQTSWFATLTASFSQLFNKASSIRQLSNSTVEPADQFTPESSEQQTPEKDQGRTPKTFMELGVNDYLGVVVPTIIHYLPTAPWNKLRELSKDEENQLIKKHNHTNELERKFQNTRAYKYKLAEEGMQAKVQDTATLISKTKNAIELALKTKEISSSIKSSIDNNLSSGDKIGHIERNIKMLINLNKQLKTALIQDVRQTRNGNTTQQQFFRTVKYLIDIDIQKSIERDCLFRRLFR